MHAPYFSDVPGPVPFGGLLENLVDQLVWRA